MTIKTAMGWCSENKAFMGFVLEDGVVVTMGLKPDEDSMQAWLDDAVARRAWEDGSELPDMYDGNPH